MKGLFALKYLYGIKQTWSKWPLKVAADPVNCPKDL